MILPAEHMTRTDRPIRGWVCPSQSQQTEQQTAQCNCRWTRCEPPTTCEHPNTTRWEMLETEFRIQKASVVILCEARKHACIQTRARPNLPVGNNTRVVTLLVLIHFHIAHENKGSVAPVGADHASACDGLRKMRIYRRPTDRLQSLKLPRRGYIKSLQRKSGREINKLLLQQHHIQ